MTAFVLVACKNQTLGVSQHDHVRSGSYFGLQFGAAFVACTLMSTAWTAVAAVGLAAVAAMINGTAAAAVVMAAAAAARCGLQVRGIRPAHG